MPRLIALLLVFAGLVLCPMAVCAPCAHACKSFWIADLSRVAHNVGMPTEADTCRTFVLPKIYAAGWTDEQIFEQEPITDGRVVMAGTKTRRRPKKKPDYLLHLTRDLPLAVIEAKAEYETVGKGLQQAKEYAEIQDLKFAYATNGKEIIEFDYLTGIERTVDGFPTRSRREMGIRNYRPER